MVSRIGRVCLLFVSTMAPLNGHAQSKQVPAYTLGPQDKIEVRVNDIRSGLGDAHNWPSFDGEFSVNPEGRVSLPLVGEIDAGGKTTAEIAVTVANTVKTEVGLTQLPKVSVQIVKFRPFYILGLVDRPGEYEFRPGLDVLQAISIAGGHARQTNVAMLGFQRDALAQKGDTQALEAERIGLSVRLARLEADLSGAETINVTSSIQSHTKDPEFAKLVTQETATLSAQRATLKAQRNALFDEQENLKRELSTLVDKNATLTRQLELSKSDLAQVNALIGKGLTISTRQLAAEQNVTANQSSQLDVQLASIRAKESLSKSVRDLIELEAKHRDDVAKDLSETRMRLSVISAKQKSNAIMATHAELSGQLASAETADSSDYNYSLTSRIGGKVSKRQVSDSEMLQPGDVLSVEAGRNLKRETLDQTGRIQ